jgi:hypothetical protein
LFLPASTPQQETSNTIRRSTGNIHVGTVPSDLFITVLMTLFGIAWQIEISGQKYYSKGRLGTGTVPDSVVFPDPGWVKKIMIQIRDEQPGSYFRELRSNFFGKITKILKFFDADPGSGMEKFRIRDGKNSDRDGKIRIRDGTQKIRIRDRKKFGYGIEKIRILDGKIRIRDQDPGCTRLVPARASFS